MDIFLIYSINRRASVPKHRPGCDEDGKPVLIEDKQMFHVGCAGSLGEHWLAWSLYNAGLAERQGVCCDCFKRF
ncbi:hypothetical protein IFT98_16820 [Pseudomonas sp. CFBP 8770]|uniref:hypothetical protein n=1 Tax=unclassified Pseudomonas TaxID=196821 RepID=UPI001784A94B|nr:MULTISPECIES: hypothetical protein [unclassified Pseudomonas]MBD8475960.1 hypothetical protein [Pseudomonas sp. CFBP 8773]MBD8648657.1 hypothetical protein [Pseudomonas sp. CFBP 8770]